MAKTNALQIEKCILAGMQTNFEAASGTPVDPFTVTEIQAYFEDPSRGNDDTKSVADIIGSNLLSLTSPGLTPPANSFYLTGAAFTNSNLNNSFFTQVTYIGAFGTTDWTSGWCNFNPQNAVY
jgi:hypothetical protein